MGLVGLRGAGHEDVGRALFGLAARTGEVLLDGSPSDLTNARTAIRSGIGFVARDRVVERIAPALTIRENAFINPEATGGEFLSCLRPAVEGDMTVKLGRRVGLSPNDPTLAIEAFSGGNEQRIVVGRWLDTGRRFMIAEDSTAGVDVVAKAAIHHLLHEVRASRMGVLVVSTDFEKVANICHRAIVFSRGRIVDELSGVSLSIQSVTHAASASNAT